jgi:hypothetical protein
MNANHKSSRTRGRAVRSGAASLLSGGDLEPASATGVTRAWPERGNYRATIGQRRSWGFPARSWQGPPVSISLIFFLCQSTVSPNPGVAAYTPPPATRLVPLPLISDAPKRAELPAETRSGLAALAQARAGDPPAKPPPRPVVRKRPRVEPVERDRRNFGFAQPWNFGDRGPSNEHAWSGGPPVMVLIRRQTRTLFVNEPAPPLSRL